MYWRRDGDLEISQLSSSGYRHPATGVSWRSNFSFPLYRALRDAEPEAQIFAFNFVRGVSIGVGDQPPIVGGGLLADGRYFAALALLLASIGLHGVTAYAVSRRTSEIGVRMALGARPASVLWLVMRQVSGLALIGVVFGAPMAISSGPLVGSLLYGVAANDAMAIAGAAVVMVAVAILAGLQPALRASRVQPLSALRSE